MVIIKKHSEIFIREEYQKVLSKIKIWLEYPKTLLKGSTLLVGGKILQNEDNAYKDLKIVIITNNPLDEDTIATLDCYIFHLFKQQVASDNDPDVICMTREIFTSKLLNGENLIANYDNSVYMDLGTFKEINLDSPAFRCKSNTADLKDKLSKSNCFERGGTND